MRHHIVGSFLLLLCTFTSLGQGPQYWTPSGGPWYARVEDIAAGVKAGHVVLYVADSAETSLMKSTDRGESWTHVLSLTSGVVRCVATEKNNPDVVYAGVRGLVDIQGLYKSTDGGTTWGKLNGFTASPRFKKISVDPTNSNCVWVGSEVVYPPVGVPVLSRTTDGGVTWSARPLGHPDYQLSVSDIVVASANVVFVSAIHGVSTRGVWRTTDDGDTWDLLIEGMAENNREISALAWDPRNPDRMYAGSLGDFTECRVYVTEDALGDCLWQQAYVENSFDVDITDLRTSPFDPDVVYASTGDFYNALGYPHDFLGILKSTNGGVTWSSANTGILAKDLRAVEVDPLDPSIVYAGGWGAFYKSTSTGQQWTDHTKGFLWMAGGLLALRGEELHACSPHLFTRSKNSGGTWQVTQFNDRILRTTSMALNPLDPKDVLSGGNAILGVDEYATLWRSTNGGDSWTVWAFPGNPTGTITALAHDKAVPGRVYATFSGGAQWSPAEVRRSDDHGATWSTLLRLDDPAFLPTLTTMSIKPGAGGQPASTIYVAGSLGGGPQVIKTTDGGLTWTNVSTGLPSTPVSSLQMDLSNPEVLYVGTSGHGVYKSVNGGQSWSESGSGLTYLNITGLLANPRNPGHLFALARESNTDYCLRTTNGGASWTAFSGGLPLIPSLAYGKLAIDPVEPYRIFVTTPVGVYSADAPPFQPTGLAWYGEPGQHPTFAWTANTEPDLAGYHIFRDGTRLNASLITTNTYIDSSITVPQNGGGVVHFYTVSAVDNASNESARSPHATFEEGLQQGERPISGGEAENRRPSESIHPRAPFGLSQNYPNPFNPSTIISYSLETDGWAELSVFDILGREVQNLVHGLTKAGRHQVVFDAAHLAPGLYFCRLQNSGSTAVQKMLLVK